MAQTTETKQAAVDGSAGLQLEERMPELLDDVLSRLSAVGVQGILELAQAMVKARLAAPAAHLAPAAVEQN